LALYASTREQELAALPRDDEQKPAFVEMQFAAQPAYYQGHYAGAAFNVLVDGQPAGRFYVSRRRTKSASSTSLLPDFCNRGIGTTLLRQLQAEARAARKPLRIHVERFNPALSLYERLEFHPIADRGVYLFMEWRG
jgi:GNAT superfamily N-acetyltransferase